jgi:hypothetical protein
MPITPEEYTLDNMAVLLAAERPFSSRNNYNLKSLINQADIIHSEKLSDKIPENAQN